METPKIWRWITEFLFEDLVEEWRRKGWGFRIKGCLKEGAREKARRKERWWTFPLPGPPGVRKTAE